MNTDIAVPQRDMTAQGTAKRRPGYGGTPIHRALKGHDNIPAARPRRSVAFRARSMRKAHRVFVFTDERQELLTIVGFKEPGAGLRRVRRDAG